jgi:hypothetical protein
MNFDPPRPKPKSWVTYIYYPLEASESLHCTQPRDMDVAIQAQHRNHPVYDPSLEPLLFSTTPLQLIIKAISPQKTSASTTS